MIVITYDLTGHLFYDLIFPQKCITFPMLTHAQIPEASVAVM